MTEDSLPWEFDFVLRGQHAFALKRWGVGIMLQPDASEGFGQRDRFGQLVTRVRGGDHEAWDEFHRLYEPKLRSVIRNKLRIADGRVRNIYDTCDFSSELWRLLWVRLPVIQIRNEEDLFSFMTDLAKKKIIDISRKQHAQKRDSKRQRLLDYDAEGATSTQLKSHEPTPSQYAMAEETLDKLERESKALNDDSALILQLKSRQNLTNHEVSEATGMDMRKVQRLLKKLSTRFFQNK